MKSFRRSAFLLLAFVFCFSCLMVTPAKAAEESPTSGKCGEHLYWRFSDGTLTITGYGPMYHYYDYMDIPWEKYSINGEIDMMIIEPGITYFSSDTFFWSLGIGEVHYTGTLAQWCEIEFGSRFANPMIDTKNMYIDGKLVAGELVIPEGVTKINDHAFVCCADVTGIVLPDTVTEIGVEAFWWSDAVTSINLPDGLTYIGQSAFERFKITSIVIPDSVTYLGPGAFNECVNLTEVVLPKGLTEITGHLFSDCISLTHLEIPDTVTRIGGYAFYGCDNLTDLQIPDSVVDLGNNAFSSVSSPTSFSLPEGTTTIGNGMFWGCTNLTDIYIPEGVTHIDQWAFCDCSGLTEIHLPQSLLVIDHFAFTDCSGLTEIVFPEGIQSIGRYALLRCTGLTSVVFPDTVTMLQRSVFDGCPNLESIVIFNSITTIEHEVFQAAYEMPSPVTEEITTISHILFVGSQEEWDAIEVSYNNGQLPGIPVHFNCEQVDHCTYCQEAGDLAHIWNGAANGIATCSSCSATKAVDPCGDGLTWSLKNGLLTISGSGNMYDYTHASQTPWYTMRKQIQSVVIGNGVTGIGSYAFGDCENLESIIIPAGVNSIGAYAFHDCEDCQNSAILVHEIEITYCDVDGHAYRCLTCDFETGLISHDQQWKWDEDHHWMSCECGWESVRKEHDLDEGKCTVCGAGTDYVPVVIIPTEPAPMETIPAPTEPEASEETHITNPTDWAAIGVCLLLVSAAAILFRQKKPQ